MEAWARNLLDVYTAAAGDLSKSLLASVEQDPATAGQYKLEDMMQIVYGGVAMVQDWLEHNSMEARDAYLNSVMPALIAGGETVPMLVAQASFYHSRMYHTLIFGIEAEHRQKAGDFIAWWNMNYLRELVRIAMDAQKTAG